MNISDYIEQDLESRIRFGGDLPERLTLSAIAEIYDVSLTPVRAALEGLIHRRLLEKLDNGRVRVRPTRRSSGSRGAAPRDQGAPALPPTSDTKELDSCLGREVILLSLRAESPEFVREESMAEQHGVGRSQVRSAFQRLAGGGLIEHVPRRGWRVPKFEQSAMDAYLDIRETLEVKALELARGSLEPTRLEAMMAGNDEAAVARGEIDNTLHAYFVGASGNRYIEAFFASNGRYYNALFNYAALGAEVVAEMAQQHLEILQHVHQRRWAKGRSALAHHIQSQRPVMEAMIALVRESR